MSRELFAGLDVDLYPRQNFGAGEVIVQSGSATDSLLVLLDGRVRVCGGRKPTKPGDLVKPVEFFGSLSYDGNVRALSATKAAIVPRDVVRAVLDEGGVMTWSLACAIAIEAIAAAGERC